MKEPRLVGRFTLRSKAQGGDIRFLTLELPADIVPGTYTISISGFISGAYFEFVDGVSSQFERNVSGTISISEAESVFSGEVDFYATAPLSQDSIHVVGTFNNISYGAKGGSTGSMSGAVFICGLVMLVLINLVLQFYVGSKVYGSEGGGILQSLRGTRTFIRGWQMPEIRSVMVIWAVLLILLLLILGVLGVMAVSTFG